MRKGTSTRPLNYYAGTSWREKKDCPVFEPNTWGATPDSTGLHAAIKYHELHTSISSSCKELNRLWMVSPAQMAIATIDKQILQVTRTPTSIWQLDAFYDPKRKPMSNSGWTELCHSMTRFSFIDQQKSIAKWQDLHCYQSGLLV